MQEILKTHVHRDSLSQHHCSSLSCGEWSLLTQPWISSNKSHRGIMPQSCALSAINRELLKMLFCCYNRLLALFLYHFHFYTNTRKGYFEWRVISCYCCCSLISPVRKKERKLFVIRKRRTFTRMTVLKRIKDILRVRRNFRHEKRFKDRTKAKQRKLWLVWIANGDENVNRKNSFCCCSRQEMNETLLMDIVVRKE